MTVAEYFAEAIEKSGRSQAEVAKLAGYAKPNIISMFKTGTSKVPIEKIPSLAAAVDVNPLEFLKIAMGEYQPATWDAICAIFEANEAYRPQAEAEPYNSGPEDRWPDTPEVDGLEHGPANGCSTSKLGTTTVVVETEEGKLLLRPTMNVAELVFAGEKIGEATTWRKNTYRWCEVQLWRTKKGTLILVQIGQTIIDGERVFVDYKVFRQMEHLTKHLGMSKLARKLYRDIGLETIEIE